MYKYVRYKLPDVLKPMTRY